MTPEIGAQAGLLKGFSLERLGRTSEALAIYEYGVKAFGDSTSGAQARGRLAELSKRQARLPPNKALQQTRRSSGR